MSSHCRVKFQACSNQKLVAAAADKPDISSNRVRIVRPFVGIVFSAALKTLIEEAASFWAVSFLRM